MNVGPESHAPGWEWYFVALYFFIGGVSAGAYFIGSLVELFGGAQHNQVSKTAYYIAFPLILITPILLIADLGQPFRFWHLFIYAPLGTLYMNPISPLSVGSWMLLVFGVFSALSFIDNLIADGVAARFYGVPGVHGLATLFGETYNRIPRILYAIAGSIAGFFVASYTGVLIGLTVRPLWASIDPLIGALFIASAGSTGAAAIALVLVLWRRFAEADLESLANLDQIALVLELVLIIAAVIIAGRFAAPLMTGIYAVMFWGGTVILGILIPLVLYWFAHRSVTVRTGIVVLTAVLVLIGGALLRISLITAGQT